ncbi:hypothetical protein PMIN06_012974 [Paraphaeosphaeria minitans]|uniref:Mitochondrial chaperone BCS1 n=1 Tax=Paraphaeosphaeria minitans TaxID=565426 RepID=A0A9P6G6C3_9PLEO|nr:mitochondrial chaperone BCS1 [Paraphaeosphaeria minitans]
MASLGKASEQIVLLDFLYPGLAPVFSSLWPLFNGVSGIYTRLNCGLLILVGRYAVGYLEALLEAYFTSKIDVSYRDEVYDMLILWVCSQPFAHSARASVVEVDVKLPTHANGSVDKKQLRYSPCNGHSYFWYRRNLFRFTRNRSQEPFGSMREEVTLSYFGRNPSVLRELLSECRRHYMGFIENKTCVFEHVDDRWKSSIPKSKRDVTTVVIGEDVKKEVIDDLAEFLDPQMKLWYSERSIPYRRGYLVHGLPGTGKSSFSLSIAGQFDLDLYVLSIPSLSDRALKALFDELPQRCVVLLEDVDAVGLDRSQGVVTDASSDGRPKRSAGKVSLSTLLNVLDGISSSEGRVSIMTTNHIEHLDRALIRPGRADKRVEFKLTDKDMISQLFLFIYSSGPSGLTQRDGSENSASGDGKVNVTQDDELGQLAEVFAAKIPEFEFSPADIMSFLLVNKQSPRRAVADVGAWIEEIREERMRLSRTSSWELSDEDKVNDP